MIPEESAIADIIRQTGSGFIIPTKSYWADGLEKILLDYLNGNKLPKRNEKEIESYSWDNISKQWIQVISQVTQT